jgi:hypothetical protein
VIISSGWSRYVKAVAMPKLPPPPRSAQRRSGSEASVTSRTSPAASTSSTASRLSAASPYFAISQPRPPPSVKPAIPVAEMAPPVTASPCSPVAALSSAQVRPPSARTVRVSGSTNAPFISARSIITASSTTARPATLCPPPRTLMSRPAARAKRTPAAASSALRQRMISAGERSTSPLWTLRAAS